MRIIFFKSSTKIPDLSKPGKKRLFRTMNIVLFSGGIILIASLLLLLSNLENADRIIFYIIPGFFIGMVLIMIYYFGFRKLNNNTKDH